MIEVGADPIGIASGEGSLWVVNADINAKRGSVSRIDPASGEVLAWVATEIGSELAGIDPSTQDVVATASVSDHGLINANQVMVFEDGSLWLPILDDGVVLRVTQPAT